MKSVIEYSCEFSLGYIELQTPLNASASTAGALFSSSTFEVPQFQREYSWQDDEVKEFWSDLRNSIDEENYFLGLVILTKDEGRQHVVDGQQRLVTLTLLVTALYHEAKKIGRGALADRIQADFLRSIDYKTDQTDPRVILSDPIDDATLQHILEFGEPPRDAADMGSVSRRIADSFRYLKERLSSDLDPDPFKRLGKWTEFLTHKVYFAVFVHPDSETAYQVFEVINTRGRELTTADLLKNYILSQTIEEKKEERYHEWQNISRQFHSEGTNTFVQYIRHVVTVQSGHILPRDLFKFLSGRARHGGRDAPTPDELMALLRNRLPLYVQMMDPTMAGPATANALKIFSALNSLGVIAVRPLLIAISDLQNADSGMEAVLRLVVRRIVVGNLGTGNVERIFGESARKVHEVQNTLAAFKELEALNPRAKDFEEQLRKRSYNKGTLGFMRRSIVCGSITPSQSGTLHFVWPRNAQGWKGMTEDEEAFWASTIGNTFLSTLERRPKSASDWEGFRKHMFPEAVNGEWLEELSAIAEWDASAVENMGRKLAEVATQIWFQ